MISLVMAAPLRLFSAHAVSASLICINKHRFLWLQRLVAIYRIIAYHESEALPGRVGRLGLRFEGRMDPADSQKDARPAR
jgi:hypothetical protein